MRSDSSHIFCRILGYFLIILTFIDQIFLKIFIKFSKSYL